MMAATKKICITALGIALFVVLSLCLQVPIFENYYLCLGYAAVMVFCYYFGPVSAMIVGSLGVVLYCLLISGLRGMPGWAIGNLVIGAAVGLTCKYTAKLKNQWIRHILIAGSILISTAIAMLVVKSAVEAFLYAQPMLLRAAKNVYALVSDAVVMIACLPVCIVLEEPIKKASGKNGACVEAPLPKREQSTDRAKGPREVVTISGLFNRCYAVSEHKDTIRCSHLPFEDGYYVTEYDVLLMVINPSSIYRLTMEGWEPCRAYMKLWYDSMDDFSDIPPEIVRELKLNEQKILPNPYTGEIRHTKPVQIPEEQGKQIYQWNAPGGSVIPVKDLSKYTQGQCPFCAIQWKQVRPGVVLFSGTGALEGEKKSVIDEESEDLRHYYYNCLGEETRMEVDWNSSYYTLVGDCFDINNWIKVVILSEDITKISNSAFFDCNAISDVYICGKNTTIAHGSFSQNVTIWSYKNSPAHEYAKNNGLQFRLLPELSVDYLIELVSI